MTIDDRLVQILRASPLPSAALGTRVYQITAPQGATAPYAVFQQVGETPSATQEGDETMKHWHYQLDVWGPDLTALRAIALQVRATLLTYTDRPAYGIERILSLGKSETWEETDRFFRITLAFDIMENLS